MSRIQVSSSTPWVACRVRSSSGSRISSAVAGCTRSFLITRTSPPRLFAPLLSAPIRTQTQSSSRDGAVARSSSHKKDRVSVGTLFSFRTVRPSPSLRCPRRRYVQMCRSLDLLHFVPTFDLRHREEVHSLPPIEGSHTGMSKYQVVPSFAAYLIKFHLATYQWAEWIDKNVDELWARQYGKPAIGHKGLNFKPKSSEQ